MYDLAVPRRGFDRMPSPYCVCSYRLLVPAATATGTKRTITDVRLLRASTRFRSIKSSRRTGTDRLVGCLPAMLIIESLSP